MESLPPPKKKLPLAVECLEDRRLLSHFGSASAWDGQAPAIENQAETSSMRSGPGVDAQTIGRGDFGYSSWAAPGYDASSAPFVEDSSRDASAGWSDRSSAMDAFEASRQASTTADCPPSTPTVTSEAFDPGNTSPLSAASPAAGWGGNPSGIAAASANVPAAEYGVAPDHAANNPAAILPHGYTPTSSTTPTPTASELGISPSSSATARASTPAFFNRPSEVTETTSRTDASAGGVTLSLAHPVDSSPQASQAITVPGSTPEAINDASARATAIPNLYLMGQDLLDGPSRVAPNVVGPRGVPDLRFSADSPSATVAPPGEVDPARGLDQPASTQPQGGVDGLEVPAPDLADMIMSTLPFDRSTLDGAIDRFLEPFDGLAPSIPGLGGRLGLVSASLTVALTVLTVEVAIRLRRDEEDEVEGDDDRGIDVLPGLRRWSRP